MNILVAVDDSECTKKAVAFLMAHLPMLEGGELVLLHVQPKLSGRVEFFVGPQALADYYREEAMQVLAPVEAFVRRHEVPCRTRWSVGRPAQQILAVAAEEGAHMILMGTHGHGMLGRAVLGSVAQGVLAHAEIPVLMVQ